MQKLTRLTLISSIGSALEYYNFVTFAMLATYLSALFFPKDNPINALLETMMLFSVAYFSSPLGAFFAIWADRHGRKTVFIASIILMSLATITIGLLPTSHQFGLWGALAIFALRFIQGLSHGAELPGGITFITEHATLKNRGFLCGLVFMGVGFGAMLSSLINLILTSELSTAQIMQWGWRLPFFFGGILGLTGYLVRRKVEETPVFLKQKPISYQLQWQAVKDHKFQFIKGIGIMLLPASMVTFGLVLPTYVEENFQYSEHTAFSALLVSFMITSLLLPVIGYWSDRVGRKLLLSGGIMATIILLLPIFDLLKLHHGWDLYVFMLSYYLLIVLMAGCYPCVLAEMFPTPIRYTGVSICYMGGFSIVGLVPVIIIETYKYSLHPEMSAVLVLLVCAVISLVAIIKTPVLTELDNDIVEPA
ncbi:MAG: MFS transporter [Gammaproteobacteria bacterium]|nr:MFS transporter [Gammaproteobacteria bacterium]